MKTESRLITGQSEEEYLYMLTSVNVASLSAVFHGNASKLESELFRANSLDCPV